MYAYKIEEFEKCVAQYFAAYSTAWEISRIEEHLNFAYQNPDDKPDFLNYNPQYIVNQVLSRPVAYNVPYPYEDTNPVGSIGDYSRRKYTYFDAFYSLELKGKPTLAVVDKDALVEVDIISFPELAIKNKRINFRKDTYHESDFQDLPENTVFELGSPPLIGYKREKPGKWLELNAVQFTIPIVGNLAIFHSIYKSSSWKYNIKPIELLNESYTSLSMVNSLINNGGYFMKGSDPMCVYMSMPIFTNPSDITDNVLENIKATVMKRVEEINTLLLLYKPYYDGIKEKTKTDLINIVSTAYANADNSKLNEQYRLEKEKEILRKLNNW
jgi:hypothetical protein